MSILIRNGTIVNDDRVWQADVLIRNGLIEQVAPNLDAKADRTIDANGSYVLPGGLDAHTHMQMPFMGTRAVDDFFTGTRAALAGGTTTIIDFVIASELSPLKAFAQWRKWADSSVCCDYGLHVAIGHWKDGETEQEMSSLVREHGVNSFKIFMAYKGTLMLRDDEMIKVFEAARKLGALPMVHAENGDSIDFMSKQLVEAGVTGPEGHLQSRPEAIEGEATHRAITLADQVGSPLYVVHCMSKSAADEIIRAKGKGCVVFGEALAAGLGLTGDEYFHSCWKHAAARVLSPPLRTDPDTPNALMNMLGNGLMDTTGSDHCVFTSELKAMGANDFRKIPNGVNGVEERMSVVWERGVQTGKLSLSKFVAVTSSNAARIFNLYPRKGRIDVGSDADVVVWGRNPRTLSSKTHHSAVDVNVFEGMEVEFGPLVVVSRGVLVVFEGQVNVQKGTGEYLECQPFAETVFGKLTEQRRQLRMIKVDRE